MMKRLQWRVEQLARAAQRRQVTRLVIRWSEQLRGVRVEARDTGVVLSGRGLIHRWLVDPTLRFISGDAA